MSSAKKRSIFAFTALLMPVITGGINSTTTTSPSAVRKCNKINSCKCEMDDGSGIINLRSLAHPGNLPKWTLSGGDGWMYKYNPCLGYAVGRFSNLAVSQASTAGTAYDLGIQSNATFGATENGEITITYFAQDKKRSTKVILKCNRETRYDQLDFIGEIQTTVYEMLLTSSCACPGYCDNYGLLEEIARTMSGYWENQFGGQRKIPSTHQAEKNNYPWSDVGTSMVALLFHDVILVIVVASIIIIYRHFYAKSVRRKNINKCETSFCCHRNVNCTENSCSTRYTYSAGKSQCECRQTCEIASRNTFGDCNNSSQALLVTSTQQKDL